MNDFSSPDLHILSSKEAARRSGYDIAYLASICRAGKVVCAKRDRQWYIEADSLDRFVEEQKLIREQLRSTRARAQAQVYWSAQTGRPKQSAARRNPFTTSLIGSGAAVFAVSLLALGGSYLSSPEFATEKAKLARPLLSAAVLEADLPFPEHLALLTYSSLHSFFERSLDAFDSVLAIYMRPRTQSVLVYNSGNTTSISTTTPSRTIAIGSVTNQYQTYRTTNLVVAGASVSYVDEAVANLREVIAKQAEATLRSIANSQDDSSDSDTGTAITALDSITLTNSVITDSTFAGTSVDTDALTLGTLNGPLQAIAGIVSATSSISAVYGGTGHSSYAIGDLLYADSTGTLARLGAGSTGAVLKISGGVPTWGTDIAGGTPSVFAYPLVDSGTVVSLAFGTTTANSWSALQQFNGGASTTQLTVSGNTYFPGGLWNSAGNVGIGTSTPRATLALQGSALFSGDLALANLTATGTATISTSIISPLHIGGTSAASSLTLQSTSGVGTTDSIKFLVGNNGTIEAARFTTAGNLGIGSTSPYAKLSVKGTGTGTGVNFQTTNSSDSPLFTILDNGNVGIGTSSPGSILAVGTTNGINFTAATSTFASAGGINLTSGCYAIGGACLSGPNTGIVLSAIRTYTSTSTTNTWTPPSNLSYIVVTVWGGGGGGATTVANYGGAGGGYATKIINNASLSGTTSVQVLVGDGGTPAATGTNGGNSSFGPSLVSATGGAGGGTSPGTPGTGVNGDINDTGGIATRGVTSSTVGTGGCAPFNSGAGGAGAGASGAGLSGRANSGCGGASGSSTGFSYGGTGLVTVYEYTMVGGLVGGTVGSGTQGQLAYYSSDGTVVSGTSSIFLTPSGGIGIGTTSSSAKLSVWGANTSATTLANFVNSASTTVFQIQNDGKIGIGSTTPWAQLSVNPTTLLAGAPEFAIGSSSATHFLVDGAGNIGIGTTSPMAALSLGSGRIVVPNGTAALPAYSFGTSGTDGMFLTVAGQLSLATAGAERLRINSANLTYQGSASGFAIQLASVSGTAPAFVPNRADTTTGIGASASGAISFITSATTKVELTNAGYLGVGSTTPWAQLSVNPTTALAGAPEFAIGSSSATHFVVTGAGNVGIGTTSPTQGVLEVNGTGVISSNSANAFVVGPNGLTNPVLRVAADVANQLSGIQIRGGSSGNGVTITTLGSGNEPLTIGSAGNQTLNLNGGSSGSVSLQINSNPRLAVGSFTFGFTRGPSTTSNSNPRFSYVDAADTGLVASTEIPEVYFNLGSSIRTHATGAITLLRDFRVTGTTHAFVGASVITDAAAFSVDGPLSAGTNSSITNSHGIYVPVTALTGTVTNAYGLTVNASTGATNNYVAQFLGGSVGIGTSSPWALLSVNPTTTLAGAPEFVIGSSSATHLIVTGAGNVGIGTTSPTQGVLEVNGVAVFSVPSSATSFVVGRTGLTNPAFSVDTTRGTATGVQIQSNGSGSATKIQALSSATNEGISISSKGTGVLTLISNQNNINWSGAAFYPTDDSQRSLGIVSTNRWKDAFLSGTVYALTGMSAGSSTPWGTLSASSTSASPALAVQQLGAGPAAVLLGGSVGIGTTTPWGQLSINPNGITGPAFAIGSSTATNFVVTTGGLVGIGTASPTDALTITGTGTGIRVRLNVTGNLGDQDSMTTYADVGEAAYWSVGADDSSDVFRITNGIDLDTNQRFLIDANGRFALGNDDTPDFRTEVVGTSGSGYFAISSSANNDGNIFTVNTSGSVGIGSTSPYAKLSIQGGGSSTGVNFQTTNSNDGLLFSILDNGKVSIGSSTPWAQLSINPTSGLAGVPEFVIGSSSATHLVVDGGGNVGIGLSNPGRQFEIGGNSAPRLSIRSTSNSGDGIILFGDVANDASGRIEYTHTTGSMQFYTETAQALSIRSNGNVNVVSGFLSTGSTTPWAQLSINPTSTLAGAPEFVIGSSSATHFIVTGAGNVGIGSTTPGTLLSVQGVANFGTATSTLYGTGGINLTAGCFAIAGTCVGGGAGTNYFTNAGSNTYLSPGTFLGIGTTTPWAQLSVNPTTALAGAPEFAIGSSSATHFVVTGAGNVGVGTASPDYSLVVEKNQNALTALRVGNTTSGTTARSALAIGASADNFQLTIDAFSSGYSSSGTDDAQNGGRLLSSGTGGFAFRVGNAAASLRYYTGSTERMRIDSTGNVGIASTTPWAQLSINPNALGSGVPEFVIGSSSATHLIVDGAGNVGIGSTTPDTKLSVVSNSTTLVSSVFKAASGQTSPLTEWRRGSDGTPVTWIRGDDGSIVMAGTLTASTRTGSSNDQAAALVINNSFNANTSGGSRYGVYGILQITGGTTQSIANNWDLRVSTTGTFTNAGTYNPVLAGAQYLVRTTSGTQTVNGQMVGAQFDTSLSTGTTITGASAYLAAIAIGNSTVGAGSTVNTSYGIKIGNRGASGTTNSYGIFLDDQSGSTNNYGIVTGVGNSGFGTTTPWAQLSINPTTILAGAPEFAIGSSSATHLIVTGAGNLGIGTTTPGSLLSVAGNAYIAGNLNIDQYSSYRQGGSLLGYASSTNFATIFGLQAGGQNATTSATAGDVTAFGYQALKSNTTGVENTAVGYQALAGVKIGNNNTAVGSQALNVTTGSSNTGIGLGALLLNTAGDFNTALGDLTIRSQTTSGTGNVGIGHAALFSKGAGNYNIAIGYNAAFDVSSGSNNIVLGSYVNPTSLTGSNQLNIGNLLYGTGLFSGTTDSSAPVVTGQFALSSSSPYAQFGIHAIAGATNTTLFAIGSSTASATTTLLTFLNSGSLGLGTTTPTSQLSVANSLYVGNTGGTASSTIEGGLRVTGNLAVGTGTTWIKDNATSTFNGGATFAGSVNVTGNFMLNGTTLSAGSSVTGTTGQLAYFSGTNTAVGTSTIFLAPSGNIGIGTTTPSATLTVYATATSSPLANFIIPKYTKTTYYYASSTWTKPANLVSVTVTVVGGGGGGVGVGSYVFASLQSGGNGGASAFTYGGRTSTTTANGGTGGGSNNGGSGGSASGGDTNYTGGAGFSSVNTQTTATQGGTTTAPTNTGQGGSAAGSSVILAGTLGAGAGGNGGGGYGNNGYYSGGAGGGGGTLVKTIAAASLGSTEAIIVGGGGGGGGSGTQGGGTAGVNASTTASAGGAGGKTYDYVNASCDDGYGGYYDCSYYVIGTAASGGTGQGVNRGGSGAGTKVAGTGTGGGGGAGYTGVGAGSGHPGGGGAGGVVIVTETYSVPVGNTAFTIDSTTGNLGVGTSTPGALLDILGSTDNTSALLNVGSIFGGATSSALVVTSSGLVGIGTSTPGYMLGVGNATIGGTVAGFVNANGTCLINPTSTSLSCSSDERLKKNITSVASSTDPLAAITKLNPVFYNWNGEADGDAKHTGFIAQQMMKVFPDLVSMDDSGFYGVNYAGLTPYLAGAIQQLNARTSFITNAASSTAVTPDGVLVISVGGNVGIGAVAQDAEAGSARAASRLQVAGTVAASGYLMTLPATRETFTFGSTTVIADLPPEVLTASSTVDLYKLATYNFAAAKALADRVNALAFRMDDLETRLATLEIGTPKLDQNTFNSMLANAFSALGTTLENGIASTTQMITGRLTIGSHTKPSGITLYDDVTGDPYCISIHNGAERVTPGECPLIDLTVPPTPPAPPAPTPPAGDTGSTTPPIPPAPGASDTTAPTVSLVGGAAIELTQGDTWNDPGATATDDTDGDLTIHIVVGGSVDASTVGNYTLEYSVSDAGGNTGSASRMVVVKAALVAAEGETP